MNDTLDRKLATGLTETPEPKKPRRWRVFGNKPKNQGLLIEEGSNGRLYTLNGEPRIFHPSGAYEVLPSRRIWLKESIGPGYLTLWFAGNPEPVTEVAPVGFGAKLWGQLVGGKLTHLAMGAFEPPTTSFQLKPWMKWVFIGVAVAGLAGFFLWRNLQRGG